MTESEENYLRGYIDAKVEDLGKTRTHRVSEEDRIVYQKKLLAKYKIGT